MKVALKNVRLSFNALFEAEQHKGQGPFNYKAKLLLAPDSEAKAAIDAAFKQVAADKWGKKADSVLQGILGNSQKCCLIDGNTKEYDGYAGNFELSTLRNQDKGRPLTIDRDKSPLTAADGKFYSGCYVNVSAEIWAQDNDYGKAIRATLLGIQFFKDGDAFGGGSAPSSNDFDDLGDGAEDDDFMS